MTTDSQPPTELWQFETDGEVQSSPTVYDDSIYVGSNDGALYAVNRDTGEERWAFPTGGAVKSSPTVFGGTVFVGSDDGTVYAIDRETGTPRWQYHTDASIAGAPIIFNLTLYVASADGRVLALDLQDQTPVWTVETDGEIVSSPLVVDNMVFVGSTDRTLTAISAPTGEINWRFETKGEIQTPPVASEQEIYIGDRTGTIYALTRADGEEIARLETVDGSGSATSPLTTVGETVVFGNQFGRIFAARVQSDMKGILWKHEGMFGIQGAPAIANNRVYIGDMGMVHAIVLDSGEKAWNIKPDQATRFSSSPTVTNGVLYIGNDNGSLYAISVEETRASRDGRTQTGTAGHHDRHVIYQSSLSMYKYLETDNDDVLDRLKNLHESIDAALWNDEL